MAGRSWATVSALLATTTLHNIHHYPIPIHCSSYQPSSWTNTSYYSSFNVSIMSVFFYLNSTKQLLAALNRDIQNQNRHRKLLNGHQAHHTIIPADADPFRDFRGRWVFWIFVPADAMLCTTHWICCCMLQYHGCTNDQERSTEPCTATADQEA